MGNLVHRPLDYMTVLACANGETATVACIVDGKDRRETITKKQLVRLLRSASEALSRMEGDDY